MEDKKSISNSTKAPIHSNRFMELFSELRNFFDKHHKSIGTISQIDKGLYERFIDDKFGRK